MLVAVPNAVPLTVGAAPLRPLERPLKVRFLLAVVDDAFSYWSTRLTVSVSVAQPAEWKWPH